MHSHHPRRLLPLIRCAAHCLTALSRLPCTRPQALTSLRISVLAHPNLGHEDDTDWAFLASFTAVRKLTLVAFGQFYDSLLAAVPAMPRLQALDIANMYEWQGAATKLGRLRARMATLRPGCAVTATYMGP